MKLDLKQAAACVALALLSACGGGGGGSPAAPGSGAAATPEVSYEAADLALRNPSVLTADRAQGEPLAAAISASVTFASREAAREFASQQVYVVVEDPASLFVAPTTLRVEQYTETTFIAGLELAFRPKTAVGNYQGKLRVFACLDAACTRQLRGSPLTVPYAVNLYGLTPSAESIAVTTPFGTTATRTITAELPNSLVDLKVNMQTLVGEPFGEPFPLNATTTAVFSKSAPLAATSTATVTVDFPVRSVGSHASSVVIYAVHRKPDGTEVALTKTIAVSQTVAKADTPDYVFVPAELNLTRSRRAVGTINDPDRFYRMFGNEGIDPSSRLPEYLSAPAAAAGHPRMNDWLYVPNSASGYHPLICNGNVESSCLPVGRYTARIPVDLIRNTAVLRRVYLPVTLDVVP